MRGHRDGYRTVFAFFCWENELVFLRAGKGPHWEGPVDSSNTALLGQRCDVSPVPASSSVPAQPMPHRVRSCPCSGSGFCTMTAARRYKRPVFFWEVACGAQRPIPLKETINPSSGSLLEHAWFAVPSPRFALAPSLLPAQPELHREHSCGKIILSPGQLRKTAIIKNNDARGFKQWSLFPVRLPKTRPINLLQVGVYFNIVLKVNQAVWLRFPPSDLVLLPSCLH